jgi:RND family efflux transporter MFP subunit
MMTSKPFRRTHLSLVGGFFLAFITLGCRGAPSKEEETPPPAPVKAEPAKETDVTQTVELFGMTVPLPNHGARISANVSAPVLSILMDAKGQPIAEGQRVVKGQVIVRLDDSLIQDQRKQAELDLESANLEIKRLDEIKKSTPKLSSQFDYDKAKLAQKIAQSKLDSLNKMLRYYTLTAPIDGRLGRIQVVPGQVVASGATVADVIDLEKQIDVLCFVPPYLMKQLELKQKARLRIGERLAPKEKEEEEKDDKEKAEKKNGGDKEKAEKKNGDEKKNEPEKKEEMKEEEEEEEFEPEGEIVLISDIAEPDTGAFAVKVRFSNEEMQLRANLAGHVYVTTQTKKKTWTIPESALMEDRDPPAVVVVEDIKTKKNEEGKEEKVGTAHIYLVTVGLRDRDQQRVEVLALEGAENKKKLPPSKDLLVVTEGGQGLHDDDAMKLEEEKEEEKEKKKD